MTMWILVGLILTLGLGLGIGELVIGSRQGLWKNIARYFLVGLVGIAIAAVSMVLIIIAIWPPYNLLSFLLLFGFIALMLGAVYFVRSTNQTQ